MIVIVEKNTTRVIDVVDNGTDVKFVKGMLNIDGEQKKYTIDQVSLYRTNYVPKDFGRKTYFYRYGTWHTR